MNTQARISALESQADRLRALTQALTEEIGALRAQLEASEAPDEQPRAVGSVASSPPVDEVDRVPGARCTRRRLLAGGLAATVAGTAGLAAAAPAAAATGAMQYGAFNNAGTDMTTLTSSNTFRTLSVLNSGTEGDAGQPKHAVYAECRNASGAALRAVGFNAGGVHATSTSPRNLAAGAVYARGGDNCGVVAISDTGAPLRLGNAVRNSVPVDAADGAWLAGDFLMLPSGQLWVCVAGGTPGVWRMLASPQAAGAFVPVTPSRVFDSRQQPPVGPLLAGSSRVVSVANSYVVNSNTVSTTNRVPVGATAIAVNLTVTAQTAPGYVYLGPGNAVTITASSINWTTGGATVANALIVPVSGAAREVRAFLRSAPGATAHVVLDVSGYFMGR